MGFSLFLLLLAFHAASAEVVFVTAFGDERLAKWSFKAK